MNLPTINIFFLYSLRSRYKGDNERSDGPPFFIAVEQFYVCIFLALLAGVK